MIATTNALSTAARRIARVAGAAAILTALTVSTQGVAQAAQPASGTHTPTVAAANLDSPVTPLMSTWNVGGSWRIRQGTTIINLAFDQAGSRLTGTAVYGGGSGPLTGSVSGNTVSFTVTWNNRSVGYYTGVIDSSGRIRNGVTYDLKNRASTASWYSL
jgi:hypothetical protein